MLRDWLIKKPKSELSSSSTSGNQVVQPLIKSISSSAAAASTSSSNHHQSNSSSNVQSSSSNHGSKSIGSSSSNAVSSSSSSSSSASSKLREGMLSSAGDSTKTEANLNEELLKRGKKREASGADTTGNDVEDLTMDYNFKFTISPPSREEKNIFLEKFGVPEVFYRLRVDKSNILISSGSVLEFRGDALVNAANNIGLGGGGIDGMFNRLGGPEFIAAREALPANARGERIKTGRAVATKAAGRLNAKHVIHAVGPDYNSATRDNVRLYDRDLANAYKDIVRVALTELKDVKSIGCCLLSAGIYSGDRGLKDITAIACRGLIDALFIHRNRKPQVNIFLIAYTEEEKIRLRSAAEHVFTQVNEFIEKRKQNNNNNNIE